MPDIEVLNFTSIDKHENYTVTIFNFLGFLKVCMQECRVVLSVPPAAMTICPQRHPPDAGQFSH